MTATPPTLVPIGRVIRLQLQLERLTPEASLYDTPTPGDHMLPVEALVCDGRGVCGLMPDGSLQRDVHHKDYPLSRYREREKNDLSLMPLGHYRRMRARFGQHMVDGIAGENVLIDLDEVLTVNDLANGLVIGDGDRQLSIDAWRVATPCAPFSKFAAGFAPDEKPDQRVTEALQFLSDGMRGFYGTIADDLTSPVEIRVGDTLFLRRA